jgi:plasmid maintenance system killer protein
MILPSVISFIDEKKREDYQGLSQGTSEEITLVALINKKLDELERDASSGKQISKSNIPKKYQDFDNLWKIDLNSRWRLLYSIVADEQGRITVIIDWLDHKEYEKLLGYHVK